MPEVRHVRMALPSPPYSTLTYALPEHFPPDFWTPGLRAAVPLGRGLRVAVLWEFAPAGEAPACPIRPLLWPLENTPLLGADYLDMVRQLALRQMVSPGRILAGLLPAGLRGASKRLRFLRAGRASTLKLSDLKALPPEGLADLAGLWLAGHGQVLEGEYSPLDSELCCLLKDPPWPVRPSAARQIELLEFLLERGLVSRRILLDALGREAQGVLDVLLRRGLVALKPLDGDSPDEAPADSPPVCNPAGFNLTTEQGEALADFRAALESGRPASRLLYGITGSGKTAVYLELAAACLKLGRSALLLAPEVALALKLRDDAEARFGAGAPVRLFHGYQSPALRERSFRELAGQSGPALVVGTRSALFLPLRDIGLIVLDEEHDSSFKQDEGLTYQAKELAWYRAQSHNALLLLGSATPDLKTFHAARQGGLPLRALTRRVGGGTLPQVRLLAMPRRPGATGLLTKEALEALAGTVEEGDQAVILLNRRGYAPLMYCLECGTVARCPHCEIGLTYHKGQERLICHYCGYSTVFPAPCAACKGLHFLPMGEGTEKLEESLAGVLPPGTRILRLDRDSTRRPGRMEEILRAFGRGEAQVLVGTQMLSKGHHFPRVTLAVVADGDMGLNLPDYRAAERTFQLLVQASGRSGRGGKAGQVIIQTRDPGHYCWNFIRAGDYEGFFAAELARREKRGYPPYGKLALIRMSFERDFEPGLALVADLAGALRGRGKELGVTVLGPAPAPLPLLRGRRRFHCLLKGQDWTAMRTLYALALELVKNPKFRISLDLDPVNML